MTRLRHLRALLAGGLALAMVAGSSGGAFAQDEPITLKRRDQPSVRST